MMYRYTTNGEFGGDIWYESVEQAKFAAAKEYGKTTVTQWFVIPDSRQILARMQSPKRQE
jgi:hypothetical protein